MADQFSYLSRWLVLFSLKALTSLFFLWCAEIAYQWVEVWGFLLFPFAELVFSVPSLKNQIFIFRILMYYSVKDFLPFFCPFFLRFISIWHRIRSFRLSFCLLFWEVFLILFAALFLANFSYLPLLLFYRYYITSLLISLNILSRKFLLLFLLLVLSCSMNYRCSFQHLFLYVYFGYLLPRWFFIVYT